MGRAERPRRTNLLTVEELDKEPEDAAPQDITPEDVEDDDANVDLPDEDEEQDAALPDDDEEEGEQASLDELIAQRAAGRRGSDDADDDSDIMALAPDPDEPVLEALPAKVAPIRDQKEFVCKSCYLVKPRVQLADAKREYCRDCV